MTPAPFEVADGKEESRKCIFPIPFAYVRTHRTYNSVLTNILKRVIMKRDLNIPIPKEGVYLGWPWADGIFNSYTQRYPGRMKLDAMCCGAFVYKHENLEDIVPNALEFTILRNPTAQFLSTFNYWLIESMLTTKAGYKVTMTDFLNDPSKFQSLFNEIEVAVVYDVTATDFGLGTSAKVEDVDTVISHMDATFGLVMIADYLYESLVLLKRTMCLTLDEVVFVDQKLLSREPELPSKHELTPLIEKLNWKSTRIYNHFNRTFWKRISEEDASFWSEVQRLKQMVAKETNACGTTQMVEMRNDERVPLLLNSKLPSQIEQCHIKWLRDDAFIEYFRGLKEKALTDGLVKFVCPSKKPLVNLVWVKTHKTGSSTMTNLLHRFAFVHNLTIALPKDDMYYHWPHKTGIVESVLYPPGKSHQTFAFDMLCSGHVAYSRAELDRVVPNGIYITLLRHPVPHFLSSWNYWGMQDKAKNAGFDVTLEEFVKDPEASILKFKIPDRRLIHNGIAVDLGLDPEELKPHTIGSVLEEYSEPDAGFTMVLINEYYDESLIVMRHKLCWDLEDIITYSLKVSPRRKEPLSPEQQQSIMRFNWVDMALYNHFNQTLWREIRQIPNFQQELEALRTVRDQMVSRCEPMSVGDHRGRYILMTESSESTLVQCVRFMMDSIEFSRVFKARQGHVSKECIRQGVTHSIGLIKPHYTGQAGDIISRILYRKAVETGLPVALPEVKKGQYYTRKYTVYSLFREEFKASILADGTPLYDADFLSSILMSTHGRFLTIVPDPVERFLDAWEATDMANRLRKLGFKGTMTEALTSTDIKVQSALDPIRNTFSKDFHAADPNSVGNTTARLIKEFRRQQHFSYVVPAPHIHKALVYLARLLCWDLETFVHVTATKTTSRRALLPADEIAAIEEFNHADTHVFEVFDKEFLKDISIEYRFDRDLQRFDELQEQARRQCEGMAGAAQDELLELLNGKGDTATCARWMLSAEAYADHVRQVMHPRGTLMAPE